MDGMLITQYQWTYVELWLSNGKVFPIEPYETGNLQDMLHDVHSRVKSQTSAPVMCIRVLQFDTQSAAYDHFMARMNEFELTSDKSHKAG